MNNTPYQINLGISKKFFYFFFIALLTSSLSLQSCGGKMVPRDDYSIDQNEIIKTEAISLMKKGAKSYESMAPKINDFKAKMNEQIEYERDKGEDNAQTVKMWELMSNPEGNLLGGFLSRWESEGKLNAPFIKEIAGQVSKNFDKIIKLEKKKKKPKM